MKVADSSETFVHIYQATRCYVILILQAMRTPHPSEDTVGFKTNPKSINIIFVKSLHLCIPFSVVFQLDC
jgi:hypothetical protein